MRRRSVVPCLIDSGLRLRRGMKKGETSMIGYVTLGTNNIEKAAKFYDELLGFFQTC